MEKWGAVRIGVLYDKNNAIIQNGRWIREVYDNPVKPLPLYAKDIIAKYNVVNADSNYLIC